MYTDFTQIWLNLEKFQVERLISDTLDTVNTYIKALN